MVVSVASAGAMRVSNMDDVASVALRDVEFCVVDLETTGGRNEFDAITEIGAVKYRGGEEEKPLQRKRQKRALAFLCRYMLPPRPAWRSLTQ